MEKEKLQFNDQRETSKLKKKPYKSPTLVQYGTVAKLTQGSRSRGKETTRIRA